MSHPDDTSLVLAETVRSACLDAARLAYEDAGIRGLCADGRWEAALTAIRQLDLSGVLGSAGGSAGVDPSTGPLSSAAASSELPPARRARRR